MIVVMVYRPEARVGNTFGYHAEDPMDGVEIFGVFNDDQAVDLPEKLSELAQAKGWKFEIDAGPHETDLDTLITKIKVDG